MTAPRHLGAFTCVAIGLTTIVGSGVYALPAPLRASLGPWSFLAFGVAALVVSLVGLMTAEAGGCTTDTGGPYQYARLAFGPRAGFAVAWLAWFNNVMSWAGVTLALVKLAEAAAPGWGSGTRGRILATIAIASFGAVNARGIKPGALLSNTLTVAKLVPLVLLVSIGLVALDPSRFSGGGTALRSAGAGAFAVAVYRCIWAAGGFENVGVVAGEVHAPTREIPRAVLLSIGASSLLYVLVQVVAVSSMPPTMGSSREAASLTLPMAGTNAATHVLGSGIGHAFGRFMIAGAAISMLGYCGGAAIVAPRYLFAMAEGGFVPAALLRRDARGTPTMAIAAATVISIVLVWGADFLTLLDASVLFSLVQHGTTICAAWKLRATIPREGRFVAPFGPVIPVLALLSMVALCAMAFSPSAGADRVAPTQFVGLAIVLALGAVVARAARPS